MKKRFLSVFVLSAALVTPALAGSGSATVSNGVSMSCKRWECWFKNASSKDRACAWTVHLEETKGQEPKKYSGGLSVRGKRQKRVIYKKGGSVHEKVVKVSLECTGD